MTFWERYQKAEFWYEKVILIELYHLARTRTNKDWTLADTAQDFSISIGLVSENLRIADAMHKDSRVLNCKTRQDALKIAERLK